MDFKEAVESRRSIRKYTDQKVEREKIEEIVRLASFSPSWKNVQATSFVVVEDEEIKSNIAADCVLGFEYNTKTMNRAAALAIVTVKHGLSGFEKDGSFSTSKEDRWEVFDAGIATQTFCLAAHEQGIGTCVLGIFDEAKVREVLGLSDDTVVAAIVTLGYAEKAPAMPPRKSVDELLTIV
ncbi:MAG: nitroreductase family protein [Eubacterium sp.]|nr:nitroreductase family protein [Eubacterium sp.]